MVWPFSRGRSKRLNESAQPTANPEKDIKGPFAPAQPQNATPRSAPRSPEESSIRKRRRSPDKAIEAETRPEPRRHRSRNSVEDITALPGARRLERSPHLRRSGIYRTAIPYSSSSVPASRLAAMGAQPTDDYGDKKGKPVDGSQKRRLSKRQEAHNRAIREEEIRAMTGPVPIPKRLSGHGDMLSRENKKARRQFSSKYNDDNRGSNVSLPFQESIHSSMSGTSEKRAWEVHGFGFLSPRPNVRLSSSLQQSHSLSGPYGPSRNGSKKEKLPALKEGVKKKDKRRVAELADDLDASDLRLLLERDSRRKEKKKLTDKEKLEAKLRRRVERDARRAAEAPPMPPTDIHPAFRDRDADERTSTLGQAPPTPTSDREDEKQQPSRSLDVRQDSGTLDRSPFRDPSPSSTYSDPYKLGPPREDTPQALAITPLETPFDDPTLHTAHEVRYSQGRLSHISTSPPTSPVRGSFPRSMSPLRREFTPELPPINTSPLKQSETLPSKKPGTWASIFRRGTNRMPDQSTSVQPKTSFSNTSRDSMSKQSIPAHLMGNTSRRMSGTPARTQSIFREDLPESPSSPPDSRINSPDIIAAANMAAARRIRRAGGNTGVASNTGIDIPENGRPARSESPNISDERNSGLAMSASLASIDSEGSWLTGRPAKRKSNASHMRSSVGSARRRDIENPSYEDLPMPDEEYVRHLTPSPEDDIEEMEAEYTPASEKNEGTLLRRDTSRRKPRLVYRNDAARSREGLVADLHSGITPLEQSPDSPQGSASELESESDHIHDPNWNGQAQVVYGKGHARQLSSGSAKLLDIRTRSGRTTPDARMSIVSSPEIQSPIVQSPRATTPTASTSKL
ncbi:hypothetical protein BDZ85DRAFT_257099 [Elsinoe ampelina]|uniref:Uncharacterized protein n=1 Tax=Elsinoe ampelina TaxID=302913 RepID=A0A6A6GMV4_9PEZI|nr:hypothetical protein BDZ85DRAFT_257099 [Elsinoe ampelina]